MYKRSHRSHDYSHEGKWQVPHMFRILQWELQWGTTCKSSSLLTWYHHRLWGKLGQEVTKIWVVHFEKTHVHFPVDGHALTITFWYLHLGSHSSPWSQNERSLVKTTTRSYHNYRSYFPFQPNLVREIMGLDTGTISLHSLYGSYMDVEAPEHYR